MNLQDPSVDIEEDANTGKRYGDQGQIVVLGLNGLKNGFNKYYVVECSVCKEDPELFKDGRFYYTLNNLNKGGIPCGCAKSRRWDIWQYEVLCKRKSETVEHSFKGFASPWVGSNKTKILLECKEHGIWDTTSVSSFLKEDSAGCPKCAHEKIAERFSLSEEEFIKRIMASGAFSERDVFTRSDKVDKQGNRVYFKVWCGQCETRYETLISSLKLGQKGCICKRGNQRFTYLNIIYDQEVPIALKFGITSNYELRQKHQNLHSRFTITPYGLWEFSTKYEAAAAERQCKDLVECKVLEKQDFKDGYTETTWAYNLDKVEEIYTKMGGVNITKDYYENILQKDLIGAKVRIRELSLKTKDSDPWLSAELLRILGEIT